MGTTKERGRRRRDNARELVQAHLSINSCIVCGESDPVVLQFHHRDRKQKKYSVGDMVSRGFGEKAIALEIGKCDVMCGNCHIRHHAAERAENERKQRDRALYESSSERRSDNPGAT